MISRRNFLSLSLGTSVISLSGCCIPSKSIEYDGDIKPLWENAYFPLAPNFITPLAASYRPLTDVHCHIFNASDLQVAGFLSGPIAYSFTNNRKLVSIIRGLAKPIEFVAKRLAISAKDEFDFLFTLPNNGLISTQTVLDQKSISNRTKAAEVLFKRIRGKKVETEINDYLNASGGAFNVLSNKNHAVVSEEFLLDAFDPNTQFSDGVEPFGKSQFGIKEVLGFMGKLLSMRYTNLNTYKAAYSENPNQIAVTNCYASIVDFDYWIGKCDHTHSRLHDQVLVMEKISELSGGYMKPLVAYNPLTDIKQNGASLKLVRNAIENHGFVGVKMYPPMGYFPGGNASNPNYPTDAKKTDLTKIDSKLNGLYALCRELKVPVMAHSNESMGRLPSHDILGGPEGWEAVFSLSENHGTKVNLGHFGGQDGGGKGDGSWTRKFVDLMAKPGSEGINGDLGYWYEIVSKDGDAIERLKAHLNTSLSGGDTVADRVMFGSDWSMISTQKGWESYAKAFHEAVGAGLESEVLDKIYFKNAQRLFSRTP